MAKVDAIGLLRSPDKEDLTKQIEEAKKKVEAALSELRALQSMDRIRKIRDGEITRKPPQKRTKKGAAGDAAGADLRTKIVNLLGAAGASKTSTIADSVGASEVDVKMALAANPDVFVKKSSNSGTVLWTLR